MKHVPKELTSHAQWVLWKTVERDGQKTKLPFQLSGELAKTNDPETWNTFEEVVAHSDGFDGPGFVFTSDDPFIGIDLDGCCRDPKTGNVSGWAMEIVKRFGSYAELSPTKTGIKIFVSGEWPFDGGRKTMIAETPFCSKLPGIEVYAERRFFAVTGWKLKGTSPNVLPSQDAIDWLVRKYFTQSSQPAFDYSVPLHTDETILKRARKYIEKVPEAISGQRGHDRAFYAACRLVLGFGLPKSDALALLCEWNQTCVPPWSLKELEHKVDEAEKQPGPRNYLRDVLPERWEKMSLPNHARAEPDASRVLEIHTLEDAAKSYIGRIESGEQSAFIQTGMRELDEALEGGYEFGEMLVLAARPSHGKSAIALQMAHAANASGHAVIMISEEMSVRSLGKRVIQFASDVPQEDWHEQYGLVKNDLSSHFGHRKPTYVIEDCGTAKRAVEEIEKAYYERGCKIALVDYAQLLRNDGKSQYEKVSNTSVMLKSVGKRLGVAVICLCQLNRDIEKRAKFIPQPSDLKDSGQFEQDADVIVFLVWPHRINAKHNPHEYKLFVSKNRNRAIVTPAFTMHFNPSRQMVLPEIMSDPNSGWPDDSQRKSEYWE